jgi:hypothetical protein
MYLLFLWNILHVLSIVYKQWRFSNTFYMFHVLISFWQQARSQFIITIHQLKNKCENCKVTNNKLEQY